MNYTLPFDSSLIIPQTACNYYLGYYNSHSDLGSLFIKLALILAMLEILHKSFNFLYDYIKSRFLIRKDQETKHI